MKKNDTNRFLLTTIIGGVLFLLPLVILVVVLAKAASIMMVVAEPMAAFLPVDSIGGVALANLLSLLLVVLLCFLAGLAARHALAGDFVKLLEAVLVNVPGYIMLKNLVSGFDASSVEGLKPVALQLGTAERLGFEIQKLTDGRSVVFIPSVPSPFSGITQVLPPDQVTYLDIPVTKIIEVTENFGHGSAELLQDKQPS
jgi:uncharacterized membrane protein